MRLIFFGTPPFAAEILGVLLDQGFEVVGVVTQPDRPQGRSSRPIPSAVKKLVQERLPSIPIFQEEKISSSPSVEGLARLEADLFVVVAFGEIIKENLLNMPRLACINVHASLLPLYRGAAPIQQSIIEGQKETGVTVMHMVKKMDAGDIIKMAKFSISEEATYGEIEQGLRGLGSRLLCEVIRDFEKGVVQATPQIHEQATYAKKILPVDCEVSWEKSAIVNHNLVRGVNPRPGAWCQIFFKGKKKRLKLMKTRVCAQSSGAIGQILQFDKEAVVVACSSGALQILEMQLEGKKRMFAGEFVKGIHLSEIEFKA